MTTLRVDYNVKYSDDTETVYYKLKGEYPRFEHDGSRSVVYTNQGPQLVLMDGFYRSAVFLTDEEVALESTPVELPAEVEKDNGPYQGTIFNVYGGSSPEDVRRVTERQGTLWDD